MRYEEARQRPLVFQKLTGMAVEEFDELLVAFREVCGQDEPGRPGRKPVLRTCEDRLFFILFYLRHYPTQDILAFLFGFSQGQASHWIHRLTPLLKQALGDEKALPQRSAEGARVAMAACPDLEFIIDGTDRPIRRPKDKDARRNDYSGKKKRHTKKNIVITDRATGAVLGLGATRPGSEHDKACADEEGFTFPPGSTLLQDTGFQGYAPQGARIEQPAKKPRGKELSPQQKEENRRVSGRRVLVEHSIGGVKVFHILSAVFRNIKAGFCDLVMETACGLFNFIRRCRKPDESRGESNQIAHAFG